MASKSWSNKTQEFRKKFLDNGILAPEKKKKTDNEKRIKDMKAIEKDIATKVGRV